MNECRMRGIKKCTVIKGTPCKGDWFNSDNLCPFFKDEETYQMNCRHTHHRLKQKGLLHLLLPREELK